MKKIPMWIGRRLVLMCKLKEEDLQEVLQTQKELNVELGVRAFLEGYVSQEDFRKIHAIQCREIKPFAAVVLEGGFLSRQQLDELRGISAQKHLRIGELLLKKGLVNEEDIESALDHDHFSGGS